MGSFLQSSPLCISRWCVLESFATEFFYTNTSRDGKVSLKICRALLLSCIWSEQRTTLNKYWSSSVIKHSFLFKLRQIKLSWKVYFCEFPESIQIVNRKTWILGKVEKEIINLYDVQWDNKDSGTNRRSNFSQALQNAYWIPSLSEHVPMDKVKTNEFYAWKLAMFELWNLLCIISLPKVLKKYL